MTRLVALAIVLVACDHPTPAPPPPPSTEIAPSQDVRGLVGTLQHEAAHRPKAGVMAEQLFDALDTAGIKLASRTQYVGATMQAAFCAGGRSGELVIAMCEYASDHDADAGLAFMNARFGMPTATRRAHRGAVMTVVHQPGADIAAVDRAFATFQSL